MPMPSRSVIPAGSQRSCGRCVGGADTSDRSDTCRGRAGQQGVPGRWQPDAVGVRSGDSAGHFRVYAFQGSAGTDAACRVAACRGKPGDDGHSRADRPDRHGSWSLRRSRPRGGPSHRAETPLHPSPSPVPIQSPARGRRDPAQAPSSLQGRYPERDMPACRTTVSGHLVRYAKARWSGGGPQTQGATSSEHRLESPLGRPRVRQ